MSGPPAFLAYRDAWGVGPATLIALPCGCSAQGVGSTKDPVRPLICGAHLGNLQTALDMLGETRPGPKTAHEVAICCLIRSTLDALRDVCERRPR